MIANSAQERDEWIKQGKKIKYKLPGSNKLFDKFEPNWFVNMPWSGLLSTSVGSLPKPADIERAVNNDALKIVESGGEYYVILVVQVR